MFGKLFNKLRTILLSLISKSKKFRAERHGFHLVRPSPWPFFIYKILLIIVISFFFLLGVYIVFQIDLEDTSELSKSMTPENIHLREQALRIISSDPKLAKLKLDNEVAEYERNTGKSLDSSKEKKLKDIKEEPIFDYDLSDFEDFE